MILLFIQNIIGWVVAHWRIVAGVVGVVFFLVIFGLVYRSCSKPPKLDQKAIIEAQQAIAKEDRKVMVEILAESDVREQGIDNSIKAVEQATEDAKKNYTGLSNDELAAELERRAKEQ
jgi:hypothetical protein